MLEAIVFLCGAAVMILEMAGTRILAPFLGTSLVVWTSLIGVVLASLSLGYWWGGRLADRRPSFRALGLIILLSGVLVAAVAGTKALVLPRLQEQAGPSGWGSILATLFLFAPPSTLLGMVTPYAVRLKMTQVEQSGRTVGRLYALSTIGSIVGTFLAGFVLIAFFGSADLLLFLGLLLALTSLLAARADHLVKGGIVLAILLAIVLGQAHDASLAAQGVRDLDTDYQRLFIYEGKELQSGRPIRVMTTHPEITQAATFLDNSEDLALAYTRFFKLAGHFRPGMKDVLMLGGGGYSFPKYLLNRYPDLELDVVELDPTVTDLARRFFRLTDNPRLRISHEDARTYLNRNRKKYDLILGDVFNSHFSIPFHLTTVETMRLVDHGLHPDGVFMLNVIGALEGPAGRFPAAEYATLRAVFPQVLVFQVRDRAEWEVQNVVLVAFKHPSRPRLHDPDPELAGYLSRLFQAPLESLPPLTDDFAPVDRYVNNW